MLRVAGLAAAVVALVGAVGAHAADWHSVEVGAVQLRVPAGWARVVPADPGDVSDPRTVVVVGTKGVTARESRCLVSSYRVPGDAAVVVVIAWKGAAAPDIPRTRDDLVELRLTREYFECWLGRGGSAQIAVKGRAYQVNVLVGDRASAHTVQQALAIARSFAAAP
jgi:hypothetical protein